MSTGKYITQGMRKKMVWLDMQHFRKSVIAARVGCSESAVSKHLNAMRESGAYQRFKEELQGAEPVTFDDDQPAPEPEPQKKMPNTGVNPEFEAAVEEMIAEREAADAEKKSANAEPEKLPGVVCRAIDDQISEYEFQICERDSRIEELKEEIAEFRKDITALKAWKEKHK